MFRRNSLAIHVSPISTPPDLFSSSTRLKHSRFHTFSVRGRRVRDTNVSGLELSVTKHITRSAQDPDGVMTRFWQVAGKLRSSSCWKIAIWLPQSCTPLPLPITWQLSKRGCDVLPTGQANDSPSGTPRPSSSRIAALDALAQRTTLKQFCLARAGEG